MFSSAPKNDGTTLFISRLAHGMVFTLSLKDTGQGERETHVWKTSYPLLDLLYPHWVPKVSFNTPIDFSSQALEHAEKAFGWKLRSTAKQFRIPETAFGDGISRVVVYTSEMWTGEEDWQSDGKFISIIRRNNVVLQDLLVKRLNDFSEKVVLVVLDFNGIEIIECEPKFVGTYKRWQYKVSKLAFESVQQFIDHMAAKRFLPFIGEHIPETQLFNLILNHTYWKPVTTSSHMVKDVWRAIITSLLSEMAPYTTLQKSTVGHVFVTGEMPLFMDDPERIQLALVDGLGLTGTWSMTVDQHSLFVPYLIAQREEGTLHEFMGSNTNLWIVPQMKRGSNTVEVMSGKSKYTAFLGNLYTFEIHDSNHEFSYKIGTKNMEVKIPKHMSVKRLIVDARPWPVVYGPNPVANSTRIPQWLDRLKKVIDKQ